MLGLMEKSLSHVQGSRDLCSQVFLTCFQGNAGEADEVAGE